MIENNSEVKYEIDNKKYHCVMDVAMHYISGKWKIVVLWYLIDDKRRFSELKRLIPDITEKMLSIQLKSLEQDGIINREVFTKKPPLKVEYSLTEFGQTLIPVLKLINKWGHKTVESKAKTIRSI